MKSSNQQLYRLFIAISAGIAFGVFSPEWGIRVTNSFRELFGAFMRFFVPFIVIGLVSASIVSIRRGAGQTLFTTLALAAVSTVISGFLAFFAIHASTPFLLVGNTALQASGPAASIAPLFTLTFRPLWTSKPPLCRRSSSVSAFQRPLRPICETPRSNSRVSFLKSSGRPSCRHCRSTSSPSSQT